MALPGILLQLAKNNPMMGQIKQMMQMLRTAQNPQAVMNQLMMSNPKLKEVMDLVKQSGGDPDAVFRTVAEKNGINPQDIYDLLK